MFLHAGNNFSILKRDVIAIIDADNSTVSKVTRAFLKKTQDDKKLTVISNDIPKSFILAGTRKKGVRLYQTNVSPATLAGRVERY
ncbi:MAG: DUF370 domain-containing protein [Oscillospiraceae bacterium]|nr:DUF370 domain-containing protein [Oscillospiraceae bacterium]